MQVFDQLADSNRMLPWEDDRLTAKDKTKLGIFRKPIMKLLKRSPAERTTARQFCDECCSLFTTNPLSMTQNNETMFAQ